LLLAGKIYNDGGLTRTSVVVVVIDLPYQDAEEPQDGEHAESGGETSQHIASVRQ